jgi:hypothetical protein
MATLHAMVLPCCARESAYTAGPCGSCAPTAGNWKISHSVRGMVCKSTVKRVSTAHVYTGPYLMPRRQGRPDAGGMNGSPFRGCHVPSTTTPRVVIGDMSGTSWHVFLLLRLGRLPTRSGNASPGGPGAGTPQMVKRVTSFASMDSSTLLVRFLYSLIHCTWLACSAAQRSVGVCTHTPRRSKLRHMRSSVPCASPRVLSHMLSHARFFDFVAHKLSHTTCRTVARNGHVSVATRGAAHVFVAPSLSHGLSHARAHFVAHDLSHCRRKRPRERRYARCRTCLCRTFFVARPVARSRTFCRTRLVALSHETATLGSLRVVCRTCLCRTDSVARSAQFVAHNLSAKRDSPRALQQYFVPVRCGTCGQDSGVRRKGGSR